jgi:pyruvate/2-oxoglutarate dehydrogenase complex dihydrolipoamide acyltransferase (E2) component
MATTITEATQTTVPAAEQEVPNYFPRTRRAFLFGALVTALDEQPLLSKSFSGDVKALVPTDEGLKVLVKDLAAQLNGASSRKWVKVLDVLTDAKHTSAACVEFLEQLSEIAEE